MTWMISDTVVACIDNMMMRMMMKERSKINCITNTTDEYNINIIVQLFLDISHLLFMGCLPSYSVASFYFNRPP